MVSNLVSSAGPPKTLQKIVPPTLGDLGCVAQRIHYVKSKGSDSVQDRTE